MAGNKVDVIVNFKAMTNDVVHQLDMVKKKLNGMNLTNGAGDKLSQSIDQAYRKAEKFIDVLSKPIKDKADMSNISKSFEGLLGSVKTVENEIYKLSGKKIQVFDNNTLNTINTLKKGIQDTRAELDKIGNSKLQTELNNLEKKANELQQKLRIKGVTGENWRIASGHAKQYIKALNEIDTAQQKINNKNISKAERDAARQDLKKAKINRDRYRGYIEKNLGFDKGISTKSQVDSFIAQQESINKLKAELNGLQSISDKAMNSLRQVFQSKGINMSANASINQYIAELEKIILEGNKASSVIKEMTNAIAKAGGVMNEQRGPATNLGQTFSQMTSWTEQMNQLQSYTATFFNVYSAINLFKRAISSAYDTVKELDAAMTDTAVVTDFTVSDMWEQLPKYTQEANKLGATIQGAYETLTLYYQQGLSQNEAWGLGIETMKMARIAGMDYAEATDMMTAAIRGFKMELNETSARHVNDVFSELAAVTASDTYEISEAMTRTASLAYSTGMDFDTASVYLAEAIETTREAPENIGTALKTILARFQSLTKNPATLDADTQAALEGETVSANIVEAALRSAGIAARDTNGEFRDTADIFLELNEKWDSLDLMTQRYIATQAAGARQQSRFIAMMQNWSRTKELLTAAQNSEGASQKQFEKTLVSMEALTNKLKNSWDQFSMGIANSNFIKAGVKVLTTFLDVINSISGALGDGAIGQGFEALFKIGLAFAAWQLLPKIIGKVFNHLAKDMVGFEVEQATMAAETESIIARMSAAYARMAAAFKPVGDAAAATAAEVNAANEAMAAGTAAGAGAAGAGAAGKMTKKGKILKIADALGLLAFSSIGGNKGKGIIGKIGAFFGGGEGGKGFKGAIAERKSKLPGWLNGQKAARDAYYNRNIANVGLNPKKVGSSVGFLGKISKAASIGLSGLGTALSAIPFGPAAAAAGVLTAAIWGIAKVVKTPKERMEEANKVLENYQEQTKKIRTSREGVSSIEDEFKALATGVDNTGKNIGLTTKQYERYKELVNELIKIHPSLVKGYDKNGQAIINNATAIKEINKALDEQEQRAIRKVTSNKNMNKILKGQIAVIRENNKELGAAANISSDWKSGGITYEKALKKSRKGDKLFLDAFKFKNGIYSKKNYQDYINEGLLNKSLGNKYAGGIDLSNLTYSETKDIVKSIPSIEKAARPLKESLSEIDQNNYDLLVDYLSKMEETYQVNQDAINTVKDNLISFMNRKDSEGKSLMSGIPSDTSDFVSTGLTALAEQFVEQGWDANELKQYTKDYAKLLQELGEGSNEYSEALRDIQDAQDEFNDSARNSEDVKKYNEAITEGTNVLSQLADQYRESGIESNIALAEALDSQINLLENFASETQATVAQAMEPFGDLVDAAGGMAESIEDTINNIGDYYTAKDSIKGVLDGIFEGIDTQGNGSKKFWETARQLMGQDVIDELGTKEAVQAQLKTLQGYFEEGEAGIAKFSQGIANHFDELDNAGFISKDGQLKWDSNGDLQQIAKIMHMNEQTLSALLEAGVQFGVTDWSNYGQLGTAIKNANYSAKVGKKGNKTTLASKEKFKAEAQENQQYQNPEQFAGLVKKTLETNKDLSFYSVDRFKTEGRDLGVNDLAKQLNAFKGGKLDASKFDTKLINKFNESTENIGEAYKTFAKEGTKVDFGENSKLRSSYKRLVDAMKTNDESKINDAYSDFYQQLSHQLTTESESKEPKTAAEKIETAASKLSTTLENNTSALNNLQGVLLGALAIFGGGKLFGSFLMGRGSKQFPGKLPDRSPKKNVFPTKSKPSKKEKTSTKESKTTRTKKQVTAPKPIKTKVKPKGKLGAAAGIGTGVAIATSKSGKSILGKADNLATGLFGGKGFSTIAKDTKELTKGKKGISKIGALAKGGLKQLGGAALGAVDIFGLARGTKLGRTAGYTAGSIGSLFIPFGGGIKAGAMALRGAGKLGSKLLGRTGGKTAAKEGANFFSKLMSKLKSPKVKKASTVGKGAEKPKSSSKKVNANTKTFNPKELFGKIKIGKKAGILGLLGLGGYVLGKTTKNNGKQSGKVPIEQKGLGKSINQAVKQVGTKKVKVEQKGLVKSINKAITDAKPKLNIKVKTSGIKNLDSKTDIIKKSFNKIKDIDSFERHITITTAGVSQVKTIAKSLSTLKEVGQGDFTKTVEIKTPNVDKLPNKVKTIKESLNDVNSLKDVKRTLQVDVSGQKKAKIAANALEKASGIKNNLEKNITIKLDKPKSFKSDVTEVKKGFEKVQKIKNVSKTVDIKVSGKKNIQVAAKSYKTLAKQDDKIEKTATVKVDAKGVKKQTTKATAAFKDVNKLKDVKKKVDIETSGVNKATEAAKSLTRLTNIGDINKSITIKNNSALKKINAVKNKWNNWSPKQKTLRVKVSKTGISNISISGSAKGNVRINASNKGKGIKGAKTTASRGRKKTSGAYGFNIGSAAAGAERGKLGPNGKGGPTLTGEVGQEMVWEPSSSSAYLVGTKGPEVVDLPGNAVVWPADQTKKILRGENHSKQLVGSEAKGTSFGSAGTFDYKKYLKVSTYTGSKASSGSKGSGGSKSSKSSSTKTNKKVAKTWENPYDEFYNLQKAINKEIRIREQLEKEYTRILKARNSTIKELTNNVKQQLGELDTIMEDASNYMYNKNLQATNYVKSSKARTFVYNNSKGNEKKGKISASTLRKYAWWDEESKTVQINWNKLNALESKKDEKESTYYQEFGAAIEDYISQLEQFQDDYEDAEDKYFDALDSQTELLEEIAQNMFDAEEKVLDILVDVREKEIERLENINDSINDGNDRLMKSIQKSIDKMRRDRDNEKTEETLAEKERRLAYLKQDTSGRNALEIKQLEKELKDERESYTDTLVDQSIDDIQSSMDEASEQRERQIEILNKQLEFDQESGEAMKDVHKLMAEAINPDGSINESSNLFKLLEASGDYQAASNQKRDFLLGELVQAVKNYGTYLGTSSTLKDAVKEGLVKAGAQKTVTYEGKTYAGTVTSGGNFVGKTNTGEEIGIKGDKLAYDSTTGDTFIGTEPLDSSDIYNPSINGIEGDKTVTAPSVPTSTTTTPSKNTTTTSTKTGILSSLPKKRESTSFSKAQRKSVQRGLNALVSAEIITGVNGKKKGTKLKVNGKIGSASKKQMKKLQKKIGVKGKSYTGHWNPTTYSKFHESKYYPAYKKGGLADFTGPAWLDGTKTRPEMVLNAQDTENFIKLKDTLSSLRKITPSSSINSNDIININIDVKEIANDYDVDQMINRVKKEITKAASNRNVNTISRRR